MVPPPRRATGLPAALRGAAAHVAEALSRRARLVATRPPVAVSTPPARLMAAELAEAVGWQRLFGPRMQVERARRRRVVILLPGFATNERRMRHMARQLEKAGHVVKRWKLGFNLGPDPAMFAALARRVCEVSARYREPVVLVGWSLGGVFAREIAKRHPECVAKVVTMGSPFSGTPYANNLWRAYQLVTGRSVERPPVPANPAVKPPVETVALWSPRDGIVSPRAACGLPGERDRAVALRCTHMGFCHDPEAIRAVLAELD